MRGSRAALAAGLMLAAPLPAFARQDAAPFIRQIMAAAGPCATLPAKSADPAADLAICEKAVAALGAMDGPLAAATPHERNIYLISLTSVLIGVGATMVQIDGVRSARSCENIEAAWTIASYLDARGSPDGYASTIAQVRGEAVQLARLCRNDRGTPAGATPLP